MEGIVFRQKKYTMKRETINVTEHGKNHCFYDSVIVIVPHTRRNL